MRLDFDRPDPTEYLAVLTALRTFHNAVAEFSWETVSRELGQDMAVLIRGQALTTDIRLMSKRLQASGGVARGALRGSDAAVEPNQLRGGREEKVGAAYVAAGSVLGGRVIAARLVAGGFGDFPRSFFNSHDLELGQIWREFKTALDAFGESGADSGRVIAGALAAFSLIRAILNSADVSPGAA